MAGEVDIHVHVYTVTPAQQSDSEIEVYLGGQSNSPLVAVTIVVPTSTTSVCGTPSHHSILLGPTVTTVVCLSQKVIPSARIEALVQHYQAAGV